MSGYVAMLFTNVVSRTNGALAGASTNTLLSANLTKTPDGSATYTWTRGQDGRIGVKISAYASAVYISYVPYGTAANALTVSSTIHDDVIPASTTVTINISKASDIIINTAGNWSALEWN